MMTVSLIVTVFKKNIAPRWFSCHDGTFVTSNVDIRCNFA